jgi:hypothetical protein
MDRICRGHGQCRRPSKDELVMRGRLGLAREYKADPERNGRDESDCIAFLVPKPGVGQASRNGGERARLVVVRCVCTRLVDESN